jgi:hypothetical protein
VRCNWNDTYYGYGYAGTSRIRILARGSTTSSGRRDPTYACSSSWGTGSPAELPGAGGDRDADLALDPHTCP